MALNCNCPCYIPRPKLRFIVLLTFHAICLILRIVAVIMYKVLLNETTTSTDQSIIQTLLIVTAITILFPFLTILLDIYHYRVWWAYEPDIGTKPEIARKPYSRKHKRFIPYSLLGRFRTDTIGNRQCQNGNNCHRIDLEHVVIFHSSSHEPQQRWSSRHPIYIGFHRTTPEVAMLIAKSDFNGSLKGMLGPGAYFARSTDATLSKIGKPDQTGAWFVAEISMGNVYPVEEHSIRSYAGNTMYDNDLRQSVTKGEWSNNHDTCYFKHSIDSKDEFCIKDPKKQILRWVVVIETPYDKNIDAYGLDKELGSGSCGFI
jgi:hypothetical protein